MRPLSQYIRLHRLDAGSSRAPEIVDNVGSGIGVDVMCVTSEAENKDWDSPMLIEINSCNEITVSCCVTGLVIK